MYEVDLLKDRLEDSEEKAIQLEHLVLIVHHSSAGGQRRFMLVHRGHAVPG